MPSKRPHLTAADSAWLQMETPTNLMTITGLMMLKGRLEVETLREHFKTRLLQHDRFNRRIGRATVGLGRHRWEPHEIDLEEHVIRMTGAESWSKQDLQDFVSRELGTPLDLSKPPWRFYVIEDYPGGSVVMNRIHHCIGDGYGLMAVLLDLTDPLEPGTTSGAMAPAHGDKTSMLKMAVKMSGKAVASSAYLLTMRRDPKTIFKGDLGVEKVAAWSENIPLDEIKRSSRALGCTLNDLLLTSVAGALRSYAKGRGEDPEGNDIRAVVPVNIRRSGDLELCNRFGLVYLSLPIGISGRLKRLAELSQRMDVIKKSPEAFVIFGLLKTAGVMHPVIQAGIVKYFAKNATAVMTNVPGPTGPLALCGIEMDSIMFWVPQSGRLGMGVSILSYNKQVRVGIATDKLLVPDPEALIDGFHAELEGYHEEARAID
jgi:WS/DGAT/MGAT family acyltransferase